MGYRWSGAIAVGECRGLTKKTELIESNSSVESNWSAFVSGQLLSVTGDATAY
jgi:hypothetical protein